jgi:uncharacterized protein YaaN involved in tellurite resistance
MPRSRIFATRSKKVVQDVPSPGYSAWGTDIDGITGTTDNYKVKIMNQNKILPQMASDGGNPFYFGGSQVPHMLSQSRIFSK